MDKSQAIDQIKQLSDAFGASGFEDEVVYLTQTFATYLGELTTGQLKNLYLARKENKGQRPHILLVAASDEVGFMVTNIQNDGKLQFLPMSPTTHPEHLLHQTVRVRNKCGDYVTGKVNLVAQFKREQASSKRRFSFQDLVIDLGTTSKIAACDAYKITVGSPIVLAGTSAYDETANRLSGKALASRAGLACLLDVLDELAGESLAIDVDVAVIAQNEVGGRSMKIAAAQLLPDLAIIFEGYPLDPHGDNQLLPRLGKGPVLRLLATNMVASPEFQEYAMRIGERNQIASQPAFLGDSGLTATLVAELGVPTLTIGIPVTQYGLHPAVMELSDYKKARELIIDLLVDLSPQKVAWLTDPLAEEF